MAKKAFRIGRKMRMAQRIAASFPISGIGFRELAHKVSPHPCPERNESLGYSIVNRAIRAGLLKVVPRTDGGRGRAVVALDA